MKFTKTNPESSAGDYTNGQVIANSGEGYKAKANAMGGINSLKENVPTATIEDKTA